MADEPYESAEQTDAWLRAQSPKREAVRIGVRWSKSHQGYLVLTNPATGEQCEIPAKGLAKTERWLLDRLPPQKRRKTA